MDNPVPHSNIQISAGFGPEIRRIAKHEAGHYIVARVLGFGVGSISITITEGAGHNAGSEIVPACPLSGDQAITGYLERRITVLYAGVLAESISVGGLDEHKANASLLTSGSRDFDKARELTHLLRNIRYPGADTEETIQQGLNDIREMLWRRAVEIVTAERSIIENLGSALAQRVTHFSRRFDLTDAELAEMPAMRKHFDIK